MKNLFTFFAAVVLTANVFAQAPQKMSYQAVIRNSSNALVSSTAVSMRISILQGSTSGTAVYVETQTATTNANGLVSLEIGAGTGVTGTFAGIDWSAGPYFIKTETDPAGGTSYSITGTSQLLSVPYALSAASASSIVNPTGLVVPKLTTAQINALPVSPAPFGTIVYNTTTNALVGYRTRVTSTPVYYTNTNDPGNSYDMAPSKTFTQTFNMSSLLTVTNFSTQILPNGGGVLANGTVTLKIYSGTPGSGTLIYQTNNVVNTAQSMLSWNIPTGMANLPVGAGYYQLTTDSTASLRLIKTSSANSINGSTVYAYDENNTLLAGVFQFGINGSTTTSSNGWFSFN